MGGSSTRYIARDKTKEKEKTEERKFRKKAQP